MLVHKSCDLGHKPDGEDRRGIYFLGSISVSFEPFGTPSGMGGMTIGLANDYSMGESGSYISSIECYDCGKSVAEFVGDIQAPKLERILDERADDYDLVEDDAK
jgi:hypothetical protein